MRTLFYVIILAIIFGVCFVVGKKCIENIKKKK